MRIACKKWERHFCFVGQEPDLVLLKCVQKIGKEKNQKILWQCTQEHVSHPSSSFSLGCHTSCSLELWLKAGAAQASSSQPSQPKLIDSLITLSREGEGGSHSIHMVFFEETQFLQNLASFRWFPSSQEDSSLTESKLYSPSIEIIPWNQKPFSNQGHGQNYTSGPHFHTPYMYRWMLGKSFSVALWLVHFMFLSIQSLKGNTFVKAVDRLLLHVLS